MVKAVVLTSPLINQLYRSSQGADMVVPPCVAGDASTEPYTGWKRVIGKGTCERSVCGTY